MSFQDIISLLFLLNHAILGHILYHPFYADPLQINEEMNEAWERGRKLATDVLNHILNSYCFLMEGWDVDFETIVLAFLAHQIRCLIRKAKAEGNSVTSALITEVSICFADCKWLPWHLTSHRKNDRPTDGYDWYDKTEYQVSTRKAATSFGM